MGTLPVVSSAMKYTVQVITGDGIVIPINNFMHTYTHVFPLGQCVWFPYYWRQEKFIDVRLGPIPYGMARVSEHIIWELSVSRQ